MKTQNKSVAAYQAFIEILDSRQAAVTDEESMRELLKKLYEVA